MASIGQYAKHPHDINIFTASPNKHLPCKYSHMMPILPIQSLWHAPYSINNTPHKMAQVQNNYLQSTSKFQHSREQLTNTFVKPTTKATIAPITLYAYRSHHSI